MDRETAKELLKIHADFRNPEKPGFLYVLKEEQQADFKMFCEIMEQLVILSRDDLEPETIRYMYSIIFWCRSWLDAGLLKEGQKDSFKPQILKYVQIMEEALYYLMVGQVEEAFWSYNEFLDGRF